MALQNVCLITVHWMNDMPIAQAFGLQQLHDVICHIVQILIRNFLEIQSLCKIHENFHIKAEWTLLNHLACVTYSRRAWSQAATRPQRRNVWLQKISDSKRDLDRVPGLTGDLRRYCRRQVNELSVLVSRCAALQRVVCALKQILLCSCEHAQ